MTILYKLVFLVLSLRPLSRAWGCIVKIRYPRFFVKRVIRFYKKVYGINMEEYEGEPEDYHSLSEFFVRRLDPQKRPLTPNENMMVSPADGRLTEVQTIYEDCATQVKGKTYAISELIGEMVDFSAGWHVAVIYLSPANYHRYHCPGDGVVTRYLHTGSRLYPVNAMGLNHVDELFICNERIVAEIARKQQRYYFVAVGATLVGSIKMEFIQKKRKRHCWHTVEWKARQLAEMGRFEIGSTIVLVIPNEMAEPITGKVGQPVRVGEPIFTLKDK